MSDPLRVLNHSNIEVNHNNVLADFDPPVQCQPSNPHPPRIKKIKEGRNYVNPLCALISTYTLNQIAALLLKIVQRNREISRLIIPLRSA